VSLRLSQPVVVVQGEDPRRNRRRLALRGADRDRRSSVRSRPGSGAIREAYKAEAVFEDIIRWKNVREEFNLEPREDDPISEFDEARAQGGLLEPLDNGYRDSSFLDPYPSIPTRTVTARKKAKKKKKAKRRQAERSRKRNRKK